MGSTTTASHRERPPPKVLPNPSSSSNDSLSTLATNDSSDTLTPASPSALPHPYSSLVYTPPARQKDQYIDDEAILARRFDGLGTKERAAAERAAARYEDFLTEAEDRRDEEPELGEPRSYEEEGMLPPGSSMASFAFPPTPSFSTLPPFSATTSGPTRHSSLPAIVTSASQYGGTSASSPIDPRRYLPTSSAALMGSAISLTPDVSPGQSPTLSTVPLSSSSSSSSSRFLPSQQLPPFHQRAATTSSSSFSSTSPRSSSSIPQHSFATFGAGGMSRSGSTPSAFSPSSISPTSHLVSSSPTKTRSLSTNTQGQSPPWAIATAGTRPGSAGTTSTTTSSMTTNSSGRPWVFDSDASSVCSAGSCEQPGAGGGGGGGKEVGGETKEGRQRRLTEEGDSYETGDEGGEVFKPESDVEFLDHRPEPPGAKLSINRDDPHQVVLKVTLPGFSLDNITVAMRRGHKVHVVADSYGENGGHFEKLVHLGSDVSSVAPRAEFNGTDLNVYIQRRPSRPSSSTSSTSTAGGSTAPMPPFGVTIPHSSSLTSPPTSPDLDDFRRGSIASSSSFSSASWSLHSSSDQQQQQQPVYPLSPSLEYPSPTSSSSPSFDGRRRSEDIPPPFTVVAPPLNPLDAESRKSKARTLIGPEGAKAAAKAAREEAARRAKEEAKKLPSSAKGGRRLPFRRQKEDGTFLEGSGSNGGGSSTGSSGGDQSDHERTKRGLSQVMGQEDRIHPGATGIDRNGTIKANSRSNSPLPPPPQEAPLESPPACLSSSVSSTDSSTNSSSSSSVVSSPTSSPPRQEPRPLPLFTNPLNNNAYNSNSRRERPKMREGNLTLRASDGQSFIAQAQQKWNASFGGGGGSRGGNVESEDEETGEQEQESLTPRWEEKGMRFHPSITGHTS